MSEPVTLWRDGILWCGCPRLDGKRESVEYRALPAAEFDAMVGKVASARAEAFKEAARYFDSEPSGIRSAKDAATTLRNLKAREAASSEPKPAATPAESEVERAPVVWAIYGDGVFLCTRRTRKAAESWCKYGNCCIVPLYPAKAAAKGGE